MKKILISSLFASLLVSVSGLTLAKLPPPDDATKAKAAEAAAKTAWSGKGDAYLLCKSQDKVAAHYRKTAGSAPAAAKDAKPTPAAAPAGPAAAAVAGTPTPTSCADPGPFAYTPAEQKPLEAAGAHSPAGNATSPPSSKTPAAALAPAKKS